MLKLEGRPTVVVGGGKVGLRKASALLASGAKVRIVATGLAGDTPPGAEVLTERYKPEHVAGALLVVACTDDRALNGRIAEDARRTGALVNVADQPEDCDFYLPAVVQRGEVILAVGTSGSAPALSAMLKEKLQDWLPQQIDAFAAALGELKDELKRTVDNAGLRMSLLRGLATDEGMELFRHGGTEALRRKLREHLQT